MLPDWDPIKKNLWTNCWLDHQVVTWLWGNVQSAVPELTSSAARYYSVVFLIYHSNCGTLVSVSLLIATSIINWRQQKPDVRTSGFWYRLDLFIYDWVSQLWLLLIDPGDVIVINSHWLQLTHFIPIASAVSDVWLAIN